MITAIVQARMGSKRLPGKTLLPFGDKTVLHYLLDRVSKSTLLEQIVVATTVNVEDDAIEEAMSSQPISIFRGHPENVLDRYYKAASQTNATIIVRITADDPFKCPEVIDEAIRKLIDNRFDYVSNTLDLSYPEGLDVEVFTFKTLQRVMLLASLPRHFEHVTSYISEHKQQFSIGTLKSQVNLSHWRLTLDYPEDYQNLLKISNLIDPCANYETLVEFINLSGFRQIMHPVIQRNESYNAQLLK